MALSRHIDAPTLQRDKHHFFHCRLLLDFRLPQRRLARPACTFLHGKWFKIVHPTFVAYFHFLNQIWLLLKRLKPFLKFHPAIFINHFGPTFVRKCLRIFSIFFFFNVYVYITKIPAIFCKILQILSSIFKIY